MSDKKSLKRSRTNRMLGGVCGGLGEYFDLDPTIIRIAFAALILLGMGSPVLGYILLWIIMPPADKMQIKAELPVTMPVPASAPMPEVASHLEDAIEGKAEPVHESAAEPMVA